MVCTASTYDCTVTEPFGVGSAPEISVVRCLFVFEEADADEEERGDSTWLSDKPLLGCSVLTGLHLTVMTTGQAEVRFLGVDVAVGRSREQGRTTSLTILAVGAAASDATWAPDRSRISLRPSGTLRKTELSHEGSENSFLLPVFFLVVLSSALSWRAAEECRASGGGADSRSKPPLLSGSCWIPCGEELAALASLVRLLSDSMPELWPRQQDVAMPSADDDAPAAGAFLETLRFGIEKRLSLCSVLSKGCLALGGSAAAAAAGCGTWSTSGASAEALDSLLVGLNAP